MAHKIHGRSYLFRVGYMGYHGIGVYSQGHVASLQMELQEDTYFWPEFFLDILIRRLAKLLLKPERNIKPRTEWFG